MKKNVILMFIGLLLFLSGTSALSAEGQVSEILDGILKRYGDLPGLEIKYNREIISSSMALLGDEVKSDPASGRFYFKPTNLIQVKQESPDPELVTSDGKTLWWYVPKENKVYRYPADKLGKELLVLSDIFSGLRGVNDSFDVVLSNIDGNEDSKLQLFPNPKWQEIKQINVIVDKATFEIKTVEVRNYLGGKTRFILGEHFIRKDMDKDFFIFKEPKGVEVIEDF